MNAEWLLCGLLVAVAISPLLVKLRRCQVWVWGIVFTMAALTAFAAVRWSSRFERISRAGRELREAIPRADRSEEYVTSDSCKSCHPSQYMSWHQSFHRTMTQVANSETVKGNFDKISLELMGQTYRLRRSGGEFGVDIFAPQAKPGAVSAAIPNSGGGDRALELSARVAMLTGSHHQQVYWIATRLGNVQMVLPFTYLLEDERWVPGNDTFLKDPSAPPTMKVWNMNCIECHTTGGQPRPVARSPRADSRVGELGIACESCHGSAVAHVRANHNPARRYLVRRGNQRDPTIVNPSHLSAKLSAQVCGQCHGIKWISRIEEWRQNGLRYHPGAELEQSAPLVRATKLDDQPWVKERLEKEPAYLEQRFWSDGMVRVSGREYNGLIESACHQRGELSCLSCHSMHRSQPDDQLAEGMETSKACLQCHQTFRDQIAKHTHHPPGSSGSECYNCHMPYTTYGLLKAIRSHQIDSPSVETSKRSGRPNACNLCHLDQSLAWTARHLSDWYDIPTTGLTDEEQSVSAAVAWLLKGDASQRALIAYSMGWREAQQTSGPEWLAPFLAQLLEDPYAAVRYIAFRSLRRLPGYRDFVYDYIGAAPQRTEAHEKALEIWKRTRAAKSTPPKPQVLMGQDQALQQGSFDRLLGSRDDRYMDLQE